ncbi:patatin-like phospholipase family protein, partial [Colwellia sp. 6M3]|uniref:patatin-like phospholipase family protein n=1 Tax=Colwellia sp. 6M3 TaxID=2759849 RepID=UPI0015F6593B
MSRYLLLLCTLYLFGCANPIDDFDTKITSNTPLKTVKSNRTLGIAISGGGLRSSAFAFGALKTLYDLKILENVDIISTVSGGGYTGYELFVNEMNSISDRNNKFGQATFGKDIFTENAYRHYYTANFVNFKAALPSILPFNSLKGVYDTKILRKFGYNEQQDLLLISDLKQLHKKTKFPELIVNTTFLDPWPTDFSEDIYEFTPTESGSEARGFHPYINGTGPELKKLIAISGAAFRPLLKQEITDPTTLSDGLIELSDGGHSENLGAFSLIKRGVSKIIIIDAEHDPEYKFGAYTSLKNRLKYWGYSLVIDDIEKYEGKQNRNLKLESPVMIGKSIAPDGKESTIYYLKAMNSEYIKELYDSKMVKNGKALTERNRKILKENINTNKLWNSKDLSNIPTDYDELFAYHLDFYPDFLRSLLHVRLFNYFDSNDIKLDFPQYSTFDQSFYNDQYFAFVALGYFSAKALNDLN